ncbi:hypothetical protein [Enterococcus sp. AD013-P3]
MMTHKNAVVERVSQEETDFPRHMVGFLVPFVHHEEVKNSVGD